jgi:hypothetical protein
MHGLLIATKVKAEAEVSGSTVMNLAKLKLRGLSAGQMAQFVQEISHKRKKKKGKPARPGQGQEAATGTLLGFKFKIKLQK